MEPTLVFPKPKLCDTPRITLSIEKQAVEKLRRALLGTGRPIYRNLGNEASNAIQAWAEHLVKEGRRHG